MRTNDPCRFNPYTWALFTEPLEPREPVTAIKINVMSSIIYIGMKLIKISPENRYQLLSSDNAGISWEFLFCGCAEVGEFFDLGSKGVIAFAKTSTGKFKSVDKGQTWSKLRKFKDITLNYFNSEYHSYLLNKEELLHKPT